MAVTIVADMTVPASGVRAPAVSRAPLTASAVPDASAWRRPSRRPSDSKYWLVR